MKKVAVLMVSLLFLGGCAHYGHGHSCQHGAAGTAGAAGCASCKEKMEGKTAECACEKDKKTQ